MTWHLQDETATGAPKPGPGVDYRNNGRQRTVRFRPSGTTGLTSVRAFVSVPVYPDRDVEGDETFAVVLSNPTAVKATVTVSLMNERCINTREPMARSAKDHRKSQSGFAGFFVLAVHFLRGLG